MPAGSPKPLRSSARRRPSTGVSTVSTRARVAGGGSALHQFGGEAPILVDVELEPARRARGGDGHVLEGGGGQGGHDHHRAGPRCRARRARFAVRVRHAVIRRRRDEHRRGDVSPEHGGAGVERRDIDQHAMPDLPLPVGAAVGAERPLAVGARPEVAERRWLQHGAGGALEVVEREHGCHPLARRTFAAPDHATAEATATVGRGRPNMGVRGILP